MIFWRSLRNWLALLLIGSFIANLIPVYGNAVNIAIEPSRIAKGDTVVLDIQDLYNGSTLTLGIDGEFFVPSGSNFAFQVRNFSMPISLDHGEVSANSNHTVWTMFSARKGSTTVSTQGNSTNGSFHLTEAYNVSPGMYDSFVLAGQVLEGEQSVTTALRLSGTKFGPDTSRISFIIDGIDAATITINVSINATDIVQKAIFVGKKDAAIGSSQVAAVVETPPPKARLSIAGILGVVVAIAVWYRLKK